MDGGSVSLSSAIAPPKRKEGGNCEQIKKLVGRTNYAVVVDHLPQNDPKKGTGYFR